MFWEHSCRGTQQLVILLELWRSTQEDQRFERRTENPGVGAENVISFGRRRNTRSCAAFMFWMASADR